jgi:polysaccharide biosynthesis transport protein
MEEKNYALQDKIRAIKKYRWLIFNCFFFAGVIVAVISFMVTPTYESETTLRVHQPRGVESSLLTSAPPTTETSKQLMATYAEILKSRSVVETMIEKANFSAEDKPAYADMLKRITIQPVRETELLSVKVQANNPEEAKKLSGLLATTFGERLTYLVRAEQKEVRMFIGARLEESKQELEKSEKALAEYKRNQKAVALSDKSRALDRKSVV